MMNNCLEKFPGGRLVGQRSMSVLMAFDSGEALSLSKELNPFVTPSAATRPRFPTTESALGVVVFSVFFFFFWS